MAEEVKEEKKIDFYSVINRRPLIDVILEPGEADEQNKGMKDSNGITLWSWRKDWTANMEANIKHFGYFNRDHSVKVFVNELLNKPCILVGAGPSLEGNIEHLRTAKELGIPIFAVHHALMYLSSEKVRVAPDFTLCLDAGAAWDEYFGDVDFLKDTVLIADQVCNTEQLKKWKGPLYFFKSAMPDQGECAKFLKMELNRICPEDKYASVLEVGGHAMGAIMSIVRGIMHSNTICFAGSDYCFHPGNGKFYPFDYKIDKVVDGEHFGGGKGVEMPAPPPAQGQIFDIFGNMVWTNGAYLQFKNVMDQGIAANMKACLGSPENVEFINASEGGALGALKGANSQWMRYLKLEDAIYYMKNKMSLPKGG